MFIYNTTKSFEFVGALVLIEVLVIGTMLLLLREEARKEEEEDREYDAVNQIPD